LQLKTLWTPPVGTLMTKQRWRDELVFPVVFGRSHSEGEVTENRTHFGLWCIHLQTSVARFIEAPFYLDKKCYGHPFSWKRKWVQRGSHEASIVFALSQKHSYDIGYHLFLFDGQQWSEITRKERNERLVTLGIDHEVRVWTDPGKLLSHPILKGGELVRSVDPSRFAVDFTHAFSYDSGPDTPRSPEYLALRKENLATGPVLGTFTRCSNETTTEALGLFPEELQDPSLAKEVFKIDGTVWATVAQYGPAENTGFLGLIQLTEDSEK